MMSNKPILKPRELEILQCLAEGLTDVEIGTRLHLAHDTVRWYNKQIFEKLGAGNRTQAVKLASELGLFNGPERSGEKKTANDPSRSPVKYVVNEGVHIAYQVMGDGPIDLLFIHGFISHLELAWEEAEYTHFFEQLAKFARVILFDKRCVGLSDRIQGAPTLENTISDAICVLDAVGSKRTYVMGTSEGGAAAVLLSSTYPDRVQGLILYGATPKLVKTNNEPAWADTELAFESMIERMQKLWGGPWIIESFAPSRAHDEQFRGWWARTLRGACSPSSVKAILDIIRDVDICQLLPHIRTRTLVIHKTGDKIVDVEAGRYFATHMPNASWLELPGDDHFFFVKSEAIISAVSEFCQNDSDSLMVDTWIGTILYIRSGNPRDSAQILQKEIAAHLPKSVHSLDDDVVAVFDSPSRAVHCAFRLREKFAQDQLRISLHVGECNVGNGKPVKTVVEASALAVEAASFGEILATNTLRDIFAGSGHIFKHKGTPAKYKTRGVNLYTIS